MKKLATLTTMAFLLGTVFAFAQPPATQDQPAPAPAKSTTKSTAKNTKKHQKTTKKTSGTKTTTAAPAAQK